MGLSPWCPQRYLLTCTHDGPFSLPCLAFPRAHLCVLIFNSHVNHQHPHVHLRICLAGNTN